MAGPEQASRESPPGRSHASQTRTQTGSNRTAGPRHYDLIVTGQDAVGLGEDVAIIAGFAEWQGCAREPVESGVRRELCGYSLGGHDGDHVRKAGGRVWNDRCVNHVEAIDTVDSSAVVDDRAYIRGRAHPARPDDVRQ